MTDRELMKLALDALKQSSTKAPFDAYGVVYVEGVKIHEAAIAALNERLAQPEQKPLSDEQVGEIYYGITHQRATISGSWIKTFARAIEAAHGIKE
jgi:hypothetical protein